MDRAAAEVAMVPAGHSTARNPTESSPAAKWFAGIVVAIYAVITLIPVAWIAMTSFKDVTEAVAYPPVVFFEPTLEGYVNLFTTRTRATPEYMESLPPPATWYDRIVRSRNMVIAGPSPFAGRFLNSVIIGFGSTFLAVFLGTLAATPSLASGCR